MNPVILACAWLGAWHKAKMGPDRLAEALKDAGAPAVKP